MDYKHEMQQVSASGLITTMFWTLQRIMLWSHRPDCWIARQCCTNRVQISWAFDEGNYLKLFVSLIAALSLVYRCTDDIKTFLLKLPCLVIWQCLLKCNTSACLLEIFSTSHSLKQKRVRSNEWYVCCIQDACFKSHNMKHLLTKRITLSWEFWS